jgi:hypothetical protein
MTIRRSCTIWLVRVHLITAESADKRFKGGRQVRRRPILSQFGCYVNLRVGHRPGARPIYGEIPGGRNPSAFLSILYAMTSNRPDLPLTASAKLTVKCLPDCSPKVAQR